MCSPQWPLLELTLVLCGFGSISTCPAQVEAVQKTPHSPHLFIDQKTKAVSRRSVPSDMTQGGRISYTKPQVKVYGCSYGFGKGNDGKAAPSLDDPWLTFNWQKRRRIGSVSCGGSFETHITGSLATTSPRHSNTGTPDATPTCWFLHCYNHSTHKSIATI